ncbi:complement C1q tumor necrosis factor-related protein 3-like [Argopecten irradians]|uniref:complement C1q tumor necrosis factor-related protein 3-like n=1 Tax=Argopecten irradians TaxID=31199 RepID=UPI0037199A20
MWDIIFLIVGSFLCASGGTDENILREFKEMKMEMANLKKSNEIMAEEIKNLKESMKQKPNISRYNRQLQNSFGVAFSAELGSDLHSIAIGAPIVYSHVNLNLGNAYDNTDGIFVAPVAGVYCFYWNLFTDSSSAFDSSLYSSKGRLADGYSHSASTGGNLVTAQLDRGDHVWVRKTDHYGNYLHERFTTFSGFLLYELESEPVVG